MRDLNSLSEVYRKSPDKHRRNLQAQRMIDIIRIHAMIHDHAESVTMREVDKIGKIIGKCQRTVYRYIVILRATYNLLGSTSFDAVGEKK